jgi:hypothetical protein
MKTRLLITLAALVVQCTVVAGAAAPVGARSAADPAEVTAPCNSIAEDGGTPLASTDESNCLNTWLTGLDLSSNTSPVTWDLGGQSYEVDKGIRINGAQDFTIENGSFYNAENPNTIAYGGTPTLYLAGAGAYSRSPIAPADDSLEDLTIEGTYPGGGLRADMANAAGVRTDGVRNLTISDVTTKSTWGDGLHLAPFLAGPKSGDHGDTSGLVENVTTDHTGRCGIAPIGVDNLTIDDASMTGTGYCAVDMEVDSGNTPVKAVTFNGLTTDSFVELDGVEGPVAINDWTVTANSSPDLLDISDATPLTIDGADVDCAQGYHYPCLDIRGTPEGTSISDMDVTMADGGFQAHPKLWFVGGGKPATFTDDCVTSNGGTYKAGNADRGAVTVDTSPGFTCPAGTVAFSPPRAPKKKK